MIFNLLSVTFILFFSHLSRTATVQATLRDFDLNKSFVPEDLSDGNVDSNIQCNTIRSSSSNASAGGKRSKTESGTAFVNKWWSKNLKYHNSLDPINQTISDTMKDYLRSQEEQLEANGREKNYLYIWNEVNLLKKDEAQLLCENAWKYLKQYTTFEGVTFTSNMTPDCDSSLILGTTRRKFSLYVGFFQYAPNLEGKSFIPDMLRCNCAFVQPQGRRNKLKAVTNTTKFFFLLKLTKQVYYVLATIGDLKDKRVKIVNVYNQMTE